MSGSPYAILQGTVTLGTNYNLSYVGANLTIQAWTLAGYYQPVDMPTGGMVWNTIKGGQTVPLKFQIFVGSVERTDVGAVKAFTATPTSCGTPGTEDLVEITTTGNTELRYSGGQFIQNWQTPNGGQHLLPDDHDGAGRQPAHGLLQDEVASRAARITSGTLVTIPATPRAHRRRAVAASFTVQTCTGQPSRRAAATNAARRHREPALAERHGQQPVARTRGGRRRSSAPGRAAEISAPAAPQANGSSRNSSSAADVLRRHHAALARAAPRPAPAAPPPAPPAPSPRSSPASPGTPTAPRRGWGSARPCRGTARCVRRRA